MEKKEIDTMFERLERMDGVIFRQSGFTKYLKEMEGKIEKLEKDVNGLIIKNIEEREVINEDSDS